ncbi:MULTISPECIES: branched-chain amino acid transporter permease [Arthrobacter]|uniref:Branched-chain amino acid transporter AzlD n=1 Tax=Arthrobacter terricola TaxID=2547396 RepID=A0A4R5KBR6_9MICC|nr:MULTISPECIES: AzlD domain-containing protein [Arthrobacter]MBT8161792.1 AzlD domain-containing protein [Arthrobacter sp. GN70]TDF92649.1 branched-chain amino acid transporter AzlD [Arthrobacter terricola]
MPDTWYIVAVLAIVFSITFALRAVPFAALGPLRRSALVKQLSHWMPAGILVILACSTVKGEVLGSPEHLLPAVVAVGVTVTAHLLGGRRTLLSVGLGTFSYVLLVNLH